MSSPTTLLVRWLRHRLFIKLVLVIGLAVGAAIIWRIYGTDDRYPKNVSQALNILPKIPSGASVQGLFCRLELAEVVRLEDDELFSEKSSRWMQYRIAQDFVIEIDCPYDVRTWGSVKVPVTGILIRQEIRGADGRVHYTNLQPSWGNPKNGGHDKQERKIMVTPPRNEPATK